ncbi:MAG TPA: hypothetical protein VGE08_17565 [Steroidobacter sp.]|uniref:hypothetical protein n=1 Tax=Steroidobacter sp. TaxID=1978227 RepID=UPI002EDA523B
MKRRAQIAKALADLRAESHPGEYHAELRRLVILGASNEKALRTLLRELEDAYPEAYKRATQQPKRSAHWLRDVTRCASWLESEKNGLSEAAWLRQNCNANGDPLERNILVRLRKRYADPKEPDFRDAVEYWRSVLRTV